MEYRGNLIAIIDLIRASLNAPDMHFVIGRILPFWNQSGGLVRAAHEWIGGMPNNAWVDSDDLGTLPGSSGSHYDAAGIVELGGRMYDADAAIT